jgi:heat shock protein HslJ
MLRSIASFGFFLALLCSITTTNAADTGALQQQIIAQSRSISPNDYAFTRTVRSEQIQGEKTQVRTVVDRYDPAKPQGQRWTLVSVDGRPPTSDEQKSFAKESPKRRVSSYARVANYFGAGATAATDAQGRTVFKFSSLPPDTVIIAGSDVSGSSAGEAVVNSSGATPFFEHVKFTLTKPTRIKLIAKIEQFQANARYKLFPDGKPVPAEFSSDAVGSLAGKSGRIRTNIVFSDVRPVNR